MYKTRIYLAILLTFQLIFFSAVINAGDIKVDVQAPVRNQPGLDKAPNGVPLVNIVTPSAKGVSHNKFLEYNVNKKGLILNNSAKVGQSELGGYIYGNPNFQHDKKEAAIVLNEVTGVTKTGLFGYTEMFGKSAEFVLANPNGIILNGAGFINMPRVTLSTGVPKIDKFGDLLGIDIEKGTISIEETLSNTENVDYFELISRVARIDAELRAGKELSIKTGRNHFDYKDKTVTANPDDPEGKPVIGIDSSLLGGMYAGRIIFISTEKGVGVNSESGIGANIDDVTITADGRVVYKDIAAEENIKIKASGDIKQTSSAFARKNIHLDTKANIEFTGDTVSGANTNIKAGPSITNSGYIGSGGDLNIETNRLTNTKKIETASNLYITGETFDNSGSEISANNKLITYGIKEITNESGKIYTNSQSIFQGIDYLNNKSGSILSNGEIDISSNTDFTIIGDYYAGDRLSIKAPNIINNTDLDMQGEITLRAMSDSFTNNPSKKISSQKKVSVRAIGDFHNYAEINSEKDITLNTDNNLHSTGTITGGTGETIVSASGTIYNRNKLGSAAALNIKAGGIENEGEIASGSDLVIEADFVKNKQGKVIYSGADLTINASDYIENTRANILSSGNMRLQKAENQNNNRITNNVGFIESQGDMTINTDNLRNIGENSGDYQVNLVNRGGYQWNSYGLMKEYIVTSTLKTDPAYITAGGSLDITGADIHNYGSAITAAGNINIEGGSLKNETAAIEVYLPHHKLLGKKWEYCDKRVFGICVDYDTDYSSHWTSGTVIALSHNPALIQSGKAIDINTTEITNTDETGYQPVDRSSGSQSVTGKPIEVSYNTAAIEKIREKGITLSDLSDIKESALFKINNTPDHPYLIETRVKYINPNDFYGSDYFLSRINYKPDRDTKVKLLGDAYYETQRVKKAIFEAAARRFLRDDIITDADQMQYLMDNAIETGKNLKLSVGIELTPGQIKALNKDIIWLVQEEINGEKVLVPRLYISAATLDLLGIGASIIKSGGETALSASEDITNTGTIASKDNLILTGKKIINTTIGDGKRAEIIGKKIVSLTGKNDILNKGGYIQGGELLALKSETGDIINQTTLLTESYAGDIRSKIVSAAEFGSKAGLSVDSGSNFINKGANIKSDGDLRLLAKNDITFDTVELRNKTNYTYGDGYAVIDRTKNISSVLDTRGNLVIESGNDINIYGSELNIANSANIKANRNFNLFAAADTYYYKSEKRDDGFLRSKTTTETIGSTKNIASRIDIRGGGLQLITDQKDINIYGSELNIADLAELDAGGDIDLKAGYNTSYYDKNVRKSGWFTGGSLYSQEINIKGRGDKTAAESILNAARITINTPKNTLIQGSRINTQTLSAKTEEDIIITSAEEESYTYDLHEKTSFDIFGILKPDIRIEQGRVGIKLAEGAYNKEKKREDKTTQHSSNIITSGGLSLDSGKNITIAGSNLDAGGDISLSAKENVNIITTQETSKTDNEKTHGSIELSLGVKHQAVEVAYKAKELYESIQKLKEAKNAYDDYKESLENAKKNYDNHIIDKEDYDDIKDAEKYYIANIAVLTGDVAIKTENMAKTARDTAGSAFTAGFDFDARMDIDILEEKSIAVMIAAKASNINTNADLIIKAENTALIEGSGLNAKGDMNIGATDINIMASRSTYESSFDKKQAHSSITVGLHGGISASASADTMTSTDKSTSYNNSKLNASNIKISSINDTRIEGGAVKAKAGSDLDIGGDLILTSLQDSRKGKYYTIGVNAGYSNDEAGGGANFSSIRNKRKAVNEQTGLYAGNSLNINVSGHTSLKGSVIHSDIKDGVTLKTETLSHENIKNKGSYTSISAGININKGDISPVIGIPGQAKVSKETKSAISSGVIITDSDLSGLSRDTKNAHYKMREIDTTLVEIQQDLAGQFGEAAFKIVGDYAMKKELQGDEEWRDGGIKKTIAHTLVGATQAAIGGGNALSGALGAGSREVLSGLTIGKSDGLQKIASIGIGAAAGAIGGNTLSGASSAFYGEAYNRQLHQKEIDIIIDRDNIKKFAEQEGITEEEAETRLANAGISMVDTKWSNIIAKDLKAEAFLTELGREHGAFTATQEEKDNFDMNGRIVEKNKDFYFKNMKDLGMIVIEKDSEEAYGATAYRKDNKGQIDVFDQFVTRGVNKHEEEVAIKGGVYDYKVTNFKGKYNAPLLYYNGSIVLPTIEPNKVHNGKKQASEIFIHGMNSFKDYKEDTGSEGCIGPASSLSFDKLKENIINFNKPFADSPGKKGSIILLREDDNEKD